MMKSMFFRIYPLCITVTLLVILQPLFVPLTLASEITTRENKKSKIVGGQTTAPALYQWEVSIAKTKDIPVSASARLQAQSLQKEGIHHCDGILLNPFWVLTAAHCVIDMATMKVFDPPQSLQVGVASKDLDEIYDRGRIPVAVINIQDDIYQPGNPTSPSDIALLRLSQPVSGPVQYGCITNHYSPTYSGPLTSVGFGNTHALYYDIGTNQIVSGINPSRNLKEVNVVDITQQAGTNPKARYCSGRPDLICITTYKQPDSTCQGDSGGSLIQNNIVVGLVSFGDSLIQDANNRITCLGQTSYTRISTHYDWIRSTVGSGFCSR